MAALWVATCCVTFLPELVMSFWMRSGRDAVKADRGSKPLVIFFANLAMGLGFFTAYATPRLAFGRYWQFAFFAGLILWISGICFRWYSIRALGRFFTFDVAISKGQTVVDSGPYRWIRHPSYTGSLIGFVGVGLTFTNWAALLVPVLCMTIGYAYRIPVEESALRAGLGQPYEEYQKHTWRLIPFIY